MTPIAWLIAAVIIIGIGFTIISRRRQAMTGPGRSIDVNTSNDDIFRYTITITPEDELSGPLNIRINGRLGQTVVVTARILSVENTRGGTFIVSETPVTWHVTAHIFGTHVLANVTIASRPTS